jgi:hypothetical protein
MVQKQRRASVSLRDEVSILGGSLSRLVNRDEVLALIDKYEADTEKAEATQPHLGIDGECDLCASGVLVAHDPRDKEPVERPALDAIAKNKTAKADYIRAIVEAIDNHAATVAAAIWGRN